MALYGPNGDAAFVASAREQVHRQASVAWVGWLVVVPLVAIGALSGSLVLLVPGLLGLAAVSALAIRRHQRRLHWMRLSAELARRTGPAGTDRRSGRAAR
jgi:hypothetical protein